MVTIRGIELDFSVSNHRHMARLEKARTKVAGRYKGFAKPQNVTQGIKGMKRVARAYITLLEGTFGSGTCNLLFGKEIDDISVLVEAWGEFEAQLEAQAVTFQQTAQTIAGQLA